MSSQNSFRLERMNEILKREIISLIKKESKDPRLTNLLITDLEISRDLSHAKVFFSIAKNQDISEVKKALDKASGFFRTKLSKSVNLRHTPKLNFIFDPTPDKVDRLEELISKL